MAGMTREQLAESAGLNATTVESLESEPGAIDALTLGQALACAKALRLDPFLLL